MTATKIYNEEMESHPSKKTIQINDWFFTNVVGFWFSRKQIAIKKTSLGTTLGLTLCKYLLSLAKIPRGIIMELDHELGRGLLPREHQNIASDISVFIEWHCI